jgi:predicted ArsR family transcriptional regulator
MDVDDGQRDSRQGPSDASVTAVAALADPSRRRMYDFIRQARRPIRREEAAASIGISRKLAAFHLDKLVEVGLLRAHFTPAPGVRRVGRTPKVYEPTEVEIRITVPERDPGLLADILIDAVLADHDGRSPREAAVDIARKRGTRLGAAERGRTRPGRLGPERGLTLASALLAGCGFEPHRETAARVALRNCPFAPQARRAPDLVCSINHAFVAGVLDGLEATGVAAALQPLRGGCCVVLSGA